MHKIRYDIGLNKNGRPCIELPKNHKQNVEDGFFSLEITRYMINDLLNRDFEKLNQETIESMDITERFLGQLSDSVAEIYYTNMRVQGELSMILDSSSHIRVKTIKERDNLPVNNIIYNDKIYDRMEGLKVFVSKKEEGGIFELINGITNEHWVKL